MQPNPTEHLGLVHHWAKKFCRQQQDYPDLVQIATLGLMKACELFDASRGVQFSTFASILIRQHIIAGLKRTQPMIRVPDAWSMDRRIPVTSLNRRTRTGDGDDGAELGDLLHDESTSADSSATANEDRARVHAALARLPARDAEVLRLRHGVRDDGTAGFPMTLDEVACVLRVSRERVRQLEQRAHARLARRLAG